MPDNISEILLEVGKTLGETAFMCSIALVIAIVAARWAFCSTLPARTCS